MWSCVDVTVLWTGADVLCSVCQLRPCYTSKCNHRGCSFAWRRGAQYFPSASRLSQGDDCIPCLAKPDLSLAYVY
ncbi:hypothetical protein EV363DRAFT_1349705 [Boletus edulis]|nr:hypothetical protein EV363DRAFT_1349705 [Boletus edulis]